MTIKGTLAQLVEQNSKVHDSLANPLKMVDMHKYASENGKGVFVITCSDPRLNPYRIFGIDPSQEIGEQQASFISNKCSC